METKLLVSFCRREGDSWGGNGEDVTVEDVSEPEKHHSGAELARRGWRVWGMVCLVVCE